MGKVVFGSFASAREREREREKERDEGKTELSQQHFVKERNPLVAMTSITKFVARYLGSISHVKVRDLPGHIHKEYVGPSNTWWPRLKNRLLEYKEDHIDEGSFTPVKQVIVGVFCMAYLVGLPAELRHLRHAEEAKKNGGAEH